MTECTCWAETGKRPYRIHHCPLHAAAPAMLAALVHCESSMNILNGDIGTAKRPCQFCLATEPSSAGGITHDAKDCDILEARKAIAQARQQAVSA